MKETQRHKDGITAAKTVKVYKLAPLGTLWYIIDEGTTKAY